MTNPTHNPLEPGASPSPGAPPHDELDSLLRRWHAENAERAAAGRDLLMARIRRESAAAGRAPAPAVRSVFNALDLLRRALVNRYSPVAASLALIVVLLAVLMPSPRGRLHAQEIMVPEGGRLDARDAEGNLIGPCPLKHTSVSADISGFFSRVTVRQSYSNPYKSKVEAVYTFPLSHRAAVDRMTMTVDDRVVAGEVKERELARQIYEAARAQNYVASLLEQERPNIFTQSVANIEPGAEVLVEISYVETLQSADGTYSFDFPMVVGPRYIPGASTGSPALVPAELTPREGVVLLGPAKLTPADAGDVQALGTLQGGKLERLITTARAVNYPGGTWWGKGDATGGAGQPVLWYRFEAAYCDGSKEYGEINTDGTGHLNGRWFYTDPKAIEGLGTGFAQDTNQVPDASRITPEPVRPGTRAGHDISLTVTIDTGGPGLLGIDSSLHATRTLDEIKRGDGLPRRVTLALAEREEIPNRDFVLSWKQTAEAIQEATFAHASPAHVEGFFTLVLQPPARVEDATVRPRELVFVMDTSGSMTGLPIEKSKEVMTRAIDAMRAEDTFNVITFAGYTQVLWDKPRPATKEHKAEALALVSSRQGGGGTEMMRAIDAALVQTTAAAAAPLSAAALAELPADGRAVEVAVPYRSILSTMAANPAFQRYSIRVRDGLTIGLTLPGDPPNVFNPEGVTVRLAGRWETRDGERVLAAERVWLEGQGGQDAAPAGPMRICMFLTDGYVGNDLAIIDAVRRNARTTRVFSFGIGNSVNRYLIDAMARAGRGEAEVVTLEGSAADADAAVARFTKRIQTPVLTDIDLRFGEGLQVSQIIPAPGSIPDLFDARPLVVHGRNTAPGKGKVTVAGSTAAGPWEREITLDLPAAAPEHDVIATLWARARVDEVLAPHLAAVQQNTLAADVKQQVVELGEKFQIMTQYTSFVAVEKSRMTIDGQPVLVAVPIELPAGVSYEGVFGKVDGDATVMTAGAERYRFGELMTFPPGGPGGGAVPQAPSSPSVGKRAKPMMRAAVVAEPAAAPAVPASLPEPELRQALQAGRSAAPALDLSAAFDASKQAAISADDLRENQRLHGALDYLTHGDRRGGFGGGGLILDELLKSSVPVGQPPGVGETAARPVFAEQVALSVAALVEQDRIDEAKPIADTLAQARPDFEIGLKMRDALADPALDPGKRKETVAALAAEARARIEAAIAELERQERLARVLDGSLRALLERPDSPDDSRDREALTLTVLVKATDDATTRALAEAGLAVKAVSRSLPIVVGTASLDRLEALALLEAVRRIEPARLEKRG